MKTATTILTMIVLFAASPASSQPATVSYWSEFDATQHLEVGRFAARNGVDHAVCLGYGSMRISKYGERRFRAFDCRAGDNTYEHERQLTLKVLGPTRFTVVWLKPQVCTDTP